MTVTTVPSHKRGDVSAGFLRADSSDPDANPRFFYPGGHLGIAYPFTPYHTTIVIQDGSIVTMNRVYTP